MEYSVYKTKSGLMPASSYELLDFFLQNNSSKKQTNIQT